MLFIQFFLIVTSVVSQGGGFFWVLTEVRWENAQGRGRFQVQNLPHVYNQGWNWCFNNLQLCSNSQIQQLNTDLQSREKLSDMC